MHHIRDGAEQFISRWFHSKGGSVLCKHSPKHQLICDLEGVLYSYGKHFPLAKWENKFGLPHLLVNMEHSTMTTNGHRAHVLGHVNKECPVRCIGSLDEAGALSRHDDNLTGLLNHLYSLRKNKDFGIYLFKYAVDPTKLLFDDDGALACYLGVKGTKIHDKKELCKAFLKHAPIGSISRKVASMVLNKKDATWQHGMLDNFLKALFNKKGYTEDCNSIKWLAHFHAVGAEAIAAQLGSSVALKIVNGLDKEE